MKNTIFKRLACIVMAVILLLPVLASVALASTAQEPVYEIIRQPSTDNPSVGVSVTDGATYQWYVVKETTKEITKDDVTDTLNGTYNEDSGWQDSNTSFPYSYFTVMLNSGDVIRIPEASGSEGFYFVTNNQVFVLPHSDGNDQIYVVENAGEYILYNDTEPCDTRVYLERIEYISLEGQTTNTLTEYEIGNEYLVKVSYEDGTTLTSDTVEMSYRILEQPTGDNPSVKVTFDDKASYTWYYFNGMEAPSIVEGQNTNELTEYEIGEQYFVTVEYEDGTEITSDLFVTKYKIDTHPTAKNPTVVTNKDDEVLKYKWYYSANGTKSYNVVRGEDPQIIIYNGDFKNGAWYGIEGYFNILVVGNVGDVLKVEVPEGFSGDVYEYDGEASFKVDENGVYYFEFDAYKSKIDFVVEDDVVENLKIYIERDGEIIPIETPSYFDDEEKILYAVGTEIGAYTKGRWVTQNGQLAAGFRLDRQVQFEVICGENVHCMVLDDDEEIQPVDGKYIVEPGQIYIVAQVIEGSEEAELDINAICDGVLYSCQNRTGVVFDDESGTMKISYVNDGHYQDGKWHSDMESNEIDIEMVLEEGYVLTVEVSEEFDGYVLLDVSNANGLEIELERVGNTYSFVSDGYYSVDLEMEGSQEEFTAVVTVTKKDALLLESEVGAGIAPERKGEYYVEVIFNNGTRVISNSFVNDKCTHKFSEAQPSCGNAVVCTDCGEKIEATEHKFSEWKTTKEATSKENGEEKRACSVCGKTEARQTEPTGGAGIGTIFVIIGSGAGAAAIAIGVAWFVLKKKSLKV